MFSKNKVKSSIILRLIAAVLLVSLLPISLSSCRARGERGEYTYRTYTAALGVNWNPHSWETSADDAIMEYLTSPLVSVLPLNSEDGSYQWSFDMAKSVVDVTESCRGDLTRYEVELGGLAPEDIDEGYVFEITLRDGLCFEGGREITSEDFIESMRLLLDPKMKNSRANLYMTGEAAIAGATECFRGSSDFSSVGIYKVDSSRFRYVCATYTEYSYLLSSFSSNWLVDTEKYKSGITSSGELLSTSYNTGKETTTSTGPYRIESHQDEKELVLVRNEWWYGWVEGDDGRLYSYTECFIDGERQEQYKTTRVVISVMDNSTAKQAFMKGELSVFSPGADEYSLYKLSDSLYENGETYTMSLFFNTDVTALEKMDRARGNMNSTVLSSDAFRRGISLAIDRAELCLATGGYTPEIGLLNSLYHYDIYNDSNSAYRDADEVKEEYLDLYGTEYGEGTPYPTLDDAYRSLDGYNLALAREAFREALGELTSAGLYTAGDEIRIKVAWAKGALSADDNRQVALLNRYISLATEGTGFGKITLVPEGQIANRYSAVPSGDYAIGYGAWGGAAFYPFRTLRVYMDPDYENLHEAACWDPKTEKLTLTVGGEDITKTWQEWVLSLTGTGVYSKASSDLKLSILAQLEVGFLAKYYRIPLAASTSCELLSYAVEYYTGNYSIMYGFGGFRLLKYHMDDYEWSEYVRRSGGRLSYE